MIPVKVGSLRCADSWFALYSNFFDQKLRPNLANFSIKLISKLENFYFDSSSCVVVLWQSC